MRLSKLLLILFFCGGVALLVGMVWQVGMTGLRHSIQAMGFWILPFLLLEAIPLLFHTAGWASCFPGHPCRPPWWRLALVQQAGNAINQITPTADVGGEVLKVLLLKPLLPREQALAAVVIDKTSVSLAKMVYIALGLLYAMPLLRLPAALRLSLMLTMGLIVLGLLGFVGCQRSGLLAQLLQRWARLPIGQGRLQHLKQQVAAVDSHLVAYYRRYPWRFVRSLLWHGTAQAFLVLKTYLLLSLLLGDQAPGLAHAYVVAATVSALDQMFFFVPGRLGTFEGARFLILSGLGAAQIYGLAFGLIARVEQLVWSGLGLVAYAYATRFVPSVMVRPVAPPAAST